MIKMHLPARLGAALLLLVMLFSLLPIAVSAEETAAPAASVEPMLLRADDYTEVVTGFRLFADNPDGLPLMLGYAIYKIADTSAPVAVPENWITVTEVAQPEADSDDDADDPCRNTEVL